MALECAGFLNGLHQVPYLQLLQRDKHSLYFALSLNSATCHPLSLTSSILLFLSHSFYLSVRLSISQSLSLSLTHTPSISHLLTLSLSLSHTHYLTVPQGEVVVLVRSLLLRGFDRDLVDKIQVRTHHFSTYTRSIL